MTAQKPVNTIAILMPGDMGHGCAESLLKNGFRVISCISGRSDRTKSLAHAADIELLATLAEVVEQADLILSILPPQFAVDMGAQIAQIMQDIKIYPDYVDCNAISPQTAQQLEDIFAPLPANFIDGGIIGFNPIKEGGKTRLYVSGPDVSSILQLNERGLVIKSVGDKIGQASAMKMVYASATKGAFSLFASVAVMAELTGLRDELFAEFAASKPDILKNMQMMVPRIPVDASRWMAEMEEISATFSSFGMTPKFHQGARELMELANKTPLASETRETLPDNPNINEVLDMYVRALKDS